MLAKLY
ncbi:Protein of unknown function [Bacillus thuringiensis]|nr:Protein of unknown function [Bacillus thuringiensis]SCM04709.1 Protein of unknown function [Bacillus wiedmannii]SCV24316.1 Protein of unknown function [Bacillus wiedmannii]